MYINRFGLLFPAVHLAATVLSPLARLKRIFHACALGSVEAVTQIVVTRRGNCQSLRIPDMQIVTMLPIVAALPKTSSFHVFVMLFPSLCGQNR